MLHLLRRASPPINPAPRANRRRQAPRGWLLVEVAIGGVMAAVILGAVLVNIGDATNKTTAIGRNLTSQMLAQQGIEQARALKNARTVLADGTITLPVPNTLRGTYTRTRTITSGTTSAGGKTLPFKEVAVSVSYPSGNSRSSLTLRTRIY